MKILLILTLNAVLTVDCRDFQDQPGNSDEATGQDQRGKERTAYGAEAAYGYNYYSTELQDVKEQKSIELRRGRQLHRDSCAGVMEIKLDSMDVRFLLLEAKMNDIGRKIEKRPCPTGFFNVGGHQCFKLFTDSGRDWQSAKTKCQEEGLQQAKPNDPLTLRKYIIDKFGDKVAWLGARGDNTASFQWGTKGSKINNFDPLWWGSHPANRVDASFCLALLTDSAKFQSQPTRPYFADTCSATNDRYALCEGWES